MEKLEKKFFWPFILGEVPEELPEWLVNGVKLSTYTIDKSPIAIPLSVALLLHPEGQGVSIKEASPDGGATEGAAKSLRELLIHEASVRKDRLKALYGPKEKASEEKGPDAKASDEKADFFALVPRPADEDSLLAVPEEIFMISLDDIQHISSLLKFALHFDQPLSGVPFIDVLDPRLPTRIARPPAAKVTASVAGAAGTKRKRMTQQAEEWGGMRFSCPLTLICAPSAEKMRAHMQGELYRRLEKESKDWSTSDQKKDFLADLDEAEAEEAAMKKQRLAGGPPAGQKGDDKPGGKGQGGKGKGGKGDKPNGKGKGKGKSRK